MPDGKLEFEEEITVYVYCETCGAHLCDHSTIECSRNHIDVKVECCPECLKEQENQLRTEYEEQIKELETEIERLREQNERK